MPIASIIALLLLAANTVQADTTRALVQAGRLESSMRLAPYVTAFPIPRSGMSPDDVLLLPDSVFLSKNQPPDRVAAEAWARFTVVNTSDHEQTNLLAFCENPDSVAYYKKQNGRLVRYSFTGTKVPSEKRDYPRLLNYIDLKVSAHDSVEVYAHVWLPGSGAWEHVFHGHIRGMREGLNTILEHYTVQAFYSGIMMVFMVISLLMFVSFREWVFVSYAGMMLSMNTYFLYSSGILRTFVLPEGAPTVFLGNQWIVGGIVISCSLFISQYLELRTTMPRYRRPYLGYSMVLGLFAVVWGAWLSQEYGYLNLLNFGLLPWVFLSFYPIIRRSVTRQRDPLVLLLSAVLITAGAVINLLSLTKILPTAGNGMVPLQLGSLAFSGTLFYGLFTKIRQIQNERAQSDAVLFNVLPEQIATELKESGETKARYLERVTVLFTDFVDFTRTSAEMKPQELVAELNTLFSMFDEIVTRYGLEKIKTIGDSYMVAGGLRESLAHEADTVIRAAIEMQRLVEQRFAERTQQGLPTFEMRAGVHTGPVVAGVVGVVKFQYDIWGDTVNTASRMESAGQPARVNISQATYDLVKSQPEFAFASRGSIEVKGIGSMPMWFVDAKTINAPSAS